MHPNKRVKRERQRKRALELTWEGYHLIIPLGPEHLERVGEIDAVAFNRTARSRENLSGILGVARGGAWVFIEQGEVVGYVFTRLLGDLAYIGPLGVEQSLQGRGIGRMLMHRAMAFLKPKCKVLGLETMPESGKNLGLYQSLGFLMGFPSIDYSFPEKAIRVDEPAGLMIKDIVAAKDFGAIREISTLGRQQFENSDYAVDLEWCVRAGRGTVLFATQDGAVAGFMAHTPAVLPMCWCGIRNHDGFEDTFAALAEALGSAVSTRPLVFRQGTRYQRMNNLLLRYGFRPMRSRTRMLLAGYEGQHMQPSDELVTRAWIG